MGIYKKTRNRKAAVVLAMLLLAAHAVLAREYHVAVSGDDANDGSAARPFRTISAAARVAEPGDVITVHEGTYRERVTPPRGGVTESQRIVYQAAPGAAVVIKGSEIIRDWRPFAPGVWKATLPNAFFGGYNPYKDLITGDWFRDNGRPHHTGEVYINGKSLWESHLLEGVLNPKPVRGAADPEGSTWTWFCESDDEHTYLYANFHDKNPNEECVEIHVRESCFYPDQPGRDYITVRGFQMRHAATQWAAPTAEQIGLIGTHWSKGWVIENNVISDSKCSGITLGKDRATGHNVWSADRSKSGAVHYNAVILRALEAGWSRDRIGSHRVRNNVIYNCEQTGICGSLGAAFSEITGNHIYDIWAKRQFGGAEMAGIKLHAAIDTRIERNRIHRAGRGLWMDWMTQGARLTRNLCYDNSTDDLYVEVNHGPFLVDHNLFLSALSLNDQSQGGAYAHNLFAGEIRSRAERGRRTPYHRPHSTEIAGLSNIRGGDNRFYNNLFLGQDSETSGGLSVYNAREFPLQTGGNVYLNGARPYAQEADGLVLPGAIPRAEVIEAVDGVHLFLQLPAEVSQAATAPVTTERLGRARIPDLPYVHPDGSALRIDADYFGTPRCAARPSPGPFENLSGEKFAVWP